MGIVFKASTKKANSFFVVFLREDLPAKTPPAEQTNEGYSPTRQQRGRSFYVA
jgi:hypothetical protein